MVGTEDSQRGPRAFCPVDRRRGVRGGGGGGNGGDVDGREREGLTGPGLPSSLTRRLSSSREAARLSFLRFTVPRSRSRSQDNCKSAE